MSLLDDSLPDIFLGDIIRPYEIVIKRDSDEDGKTILVTWVEDIGDEGLYDSVVTKKLEQQFSEKVGTTVFRDLFGETEVWNEVPTLALTAEYRNYPHNLTVGGLRRFCQVNG